MEFRFNDGTTCRAPATARFSGSTLRVVDADSTCSPRGTWAQDRLDCTSGADGVAYCRGENRTELDRQPAPRRELRIISPARRVST
jgi:hypothetical protein